MRSFVIKLAQARSTTAAVQRTISLLDLSDHRFDDPLGSASTSSAVSPTRSLRASIAFFIAAGDVKSL
jgi:hypothetical protein